MFRQPRPAPRPIRVVVVNGPTPVGSKIDPAKLKTVDWPADAVPVGAFHAVAEVGAGKIALTSLVAGEPLLPARISDRDAGARIAAGLGPDMRAATVRVTDVTGVGGFVLPGARVDVIVTRAAVGQEPPITDTLAQNVRVIAVNQDSDQAKDKPEVVQSVTLEVTPLQAQKLALAHIVGTVSLVLRNPVNTEATAARTVRIGDLGEGAARSPVVHSAMRAVHIAHHRPAHLAPAGNEIEIVRGVERTSYRIARSE